MFGKRLTIFTIFGFRVRADASWLIIAVLVTWSLAAGIFPQEYRDLSVVSFWLMGVCGALGLFLSVVVHEFFHSLVARRLGLPMDGITLFVFGGVAEMSGEPETPRVEFLMAAAGPASSIVLGALFYAVYSAGMRAGWPLQIEGVLSYLASINWVLAVFNLLPAFPLDGGRILRAALWRWKKNLPQATHRAATIGTGFGLLMIVAGVVNLLFGNIIGGLWLFLIGMFLRRAAESSYQQLVVRTALEGTPVEQIMKKDPMTI
ncbi:MAG: site-2 protease family protein, partial [Nitrospiraceae bacterium]|nr:site-2 protease family protein [Nitrospiraceae bacterium]